MSSTWLSECQSYIYRINIGLLEHSPRIEINQNGRSLSYKESFDEYNGMIYCATVSTRALLVRRNDKVVVSGNSPFEHIAQAPESYSYDCWWGSILRAGNNTVKLLTTKIAKPSTLLELLA